MYSSIMNFLYGSFCSAIIFIYLIKKIYVRVPAKIAKINGRTIKETGDEAIFAFSQILLRSEVNENVTLKQWFGSSSYNQWKINVAKFYKSKISQNV